MLPAKPASLVRFGPFTYDCAQSLLRHQEREVPLPPRVLAVLHLLITRAGEIVPKQELLEAVWKDAFVTDTSLAEAISTLRQALGDDPQSPTFIQTVHRRGYRFIAQISDQRPHFPAHATVPIEEVRRTATPSIGMQLVPWSVAVLTTLIAVVAVWQFTRRAGPEIPVVRIPIEPAPGTHFGTERAALALSPDGTVAAWRACGARVCRLYVRMMDRLEPRAIDGTDGAEAPFFSPDGHWIGFFANGKLKKVALSGGAPVAITDAPAGLGGAWLSDGSIVFASSRRSGLLRVSERGGASVVFTQPKPAGREVGHAWPAASSDGRTLVFSVLTSPTEGNPARAAMLRVSEGPQAWRTLVERADLAQPATRDYLVYSRRHELHAVPLDALRQATAGEDRAILTGIAHGQFAVSANGALFHAVAPTPLAASLVWMRAGQPSLTESRVDPSWLDPSAEPPVLSPDGRRIAWSRVDDTATDIWVADLDRGTSTRLTHGGVNVCPTWSADGSGVYFASSRGGAFEIWQRNAAAAAPEQRVLSASDRHRHLFPSSVSRDGRRLAYVESDGNTRGDLGVLTAAGSVEQLVTSPFDETAPALSPDGRWVAYTSDESGHNEVYLMNLESRRRVGVSTAGGGAPLWSHDGKALLFQNGPILARATVDWTTGQGSAPVVLEADLRGSTAGIAADGAVLVMTGAPRPPALGVLTIEWVREIRRSLGPPTSALPR